MGIGFTCHSLLTLGTCERTRIHLMKNARERKKNPNIYDYALIYTLYYDLFFSFSSKRDY